MGNEKNRDKNRERLKSVALAWLPALVYMALIFILSSIPTLASYSKHLPFRDKGAHFLEYAILGALTTHAAGRTFPELHRGRVFLFGVMLATLFGVSDELHQAFVPGRRADFGDIIADFLGAIVGGLVRLMLRR